VPGIDRDCTELHDVEERREIAANEPLLGLEAFVRNRFDTHGVRRVLGCTLLVE